MPARLRTVVARHCSAPPLSDGCLQWLALPATRHQFRRSTSYIRVTVRPEVFGLAPTAPAVCRRQRQDPRLRDRLPAAVARPANRRPAPPRRLGRIDLSVGKDYETEVWLARPRPQREIFNPLTTCSLAANRGRSSPPTDQAGTIRADLSISPSERRSAASPFTATHSPFEP
jgi:hypothetical protein